MKGNYHNLSVDSHSRLFGEPNENSPRSKPNFMKSNIFGPEFVAAQEKPIEATGSPPPAKTAVGNGNGEVLNASQNNNHGDVIQTTFSYGDFPLLLAARNNGGNVLTGEGYLEEPRRQKRQYSNTHATPGFW